MKKKLIIITICLFSIYTFVITFNIDKKDKIISDKIVTDLNDEYTNDEEIIVVNDNIKENIINKESKDNMIEKTSDKEVIDKDKYIDNYFNNINDLIELDVISDKVKNKFVIAVDFIFYEGKINDITFKELSNQTKIKILSLMIKIDSKIEERFPKYKNIINNKYSNIRKKVISKYLDVTVDICNKDIDMCTIAKDNFKSMKESFDISWNFIKEILQDEAYKLNDWHMVWKYK